MVLKRVLPPTKKANGPRRATSHYVGKAGQLAVMAELAWRGYNVSIPEVDVGDDVFALDDSSGDLTRVQVKTATGKRLLRQKMAYRCQFRIDKRHVQRGSSGTHYVLAGRCGGSWRYLVFKRFVFARLLDGGGLGVRNGTDHYMVTVVFFDRSTAKTSTLSNAIDLSPHAGKWSLWKRLPGGAMPD
jgi:hypothetical protein